jgi:hypothetical protein
MTQVYNLINFDIGLFVYTNESVIIIKGDRPQSPFYNVFIYIALYMPEKPSLLPLSTLLHPWTTTDLLSVTAAAFSSILC